MWIIVYGGLNFLDLFLDEVKIGFFELRIKRR